MVDSVGIVGAGVAVDAIEAALTGDRFAAERIDVADATGYDRVVVVAPAGAASFFEVNDIAESWLAVEIGGVGARGLPAVDAAITTFGPESGCYACLCQRVDSHRESERSTPDDGGSVPSHTTRLVGALAGHRLHAWTRGETDAGSVLEIPYATRRLFPVPGCSCGGPVQRSLDRTASDGELGEALERAESTVDPRLGLVEEVGEVHSFPAPYYLAALADTTGFSDVQAGRHAAGVSPDWNAAYVKAVGEALERYAAGVYRAESVETAPPAEVPRSIPPERFVRPEDGYERPDPERAIRWIAGEDLRTGETVQLPLEFVQYPPPDSPHKPAITTGLGLGTDGVGALVSGLSEVIERDATMLAWYSTFEPIELDVDTDQFETLRRRARSESLSVTPLLLTQDIDVPVVAVAVHRDSTWPKFAVGSAAALHPAKAAENALCEALQNWMELREMGPEEASTDATSIATYAEFPREARNFLETHSSVPASSVGPADSPEGEAELHALVDRLDAVDLDAYAARITTPDVDAAGFEVVRVLVPDAQPLFTDERYFGDRARSVPRELGYRPRLDRPHHPYP